MLDRLTTMLRHQSELQAGSYGVAPGELAVDDAVDYIRMHTLACTDELHEALAGTSWKSWADSSYLDGPRVFAELTDALFFLMNLMLAASPGLPPEAVADRLFRTYEAKRAVNAKRQLDGYATQSGVRND